ncbi:MAG: hypothetical protein ACUZ8H_10335 [Candidatus Anammoxibacter sp.]
MNRSIIPATRFIRDACITFYGVRMPLGKNNSVNGRVWGKQMNNIKNKLYGAIGVLVIVGIIALAIWGITYKFNDCKHVGHSMVYCIMDLD